MFQTRQPSTVRSVVQAAAALMFERSNKPGVKIREIAGDGLSPIEMAAALSDAVRCLIPCLTNETEEAQ